MKETTVEIKDLLLEPSVTLIGLRKRLFSEKAGNCLVCVGLYGRPCARSDGRQRMNYAKLKSLLSPASIDEETVLAAAWQFTLLARRITFWENATEKAGASLVFGLNKYLYIFSKC